MRSLSGSRLRIAAFVPLFSVSVIAVVVSAASGATSSKSLIAIHEQGKNIAPPYGHRTRGKFTIELKKAPFGPGGTTNIYPSAGATRDVNGQAQIPLTGSDTLTSKSGQITLAFRGTYIGVNSKLSTSGQALGPGAEYGTWKIKSASGMYQGWKGGGNWAAVISGYSIAQPYSLEWDGYITS